MSDIPNNNGSWTKMALVAIVAGILGMALCWFFLRNHSDDEQFEYNTEELTVDIDDPEMKALLDSIAAAPERDEPHINWERKYLKDDFGDDDLSRPYLQLYLHGHIARGQGDYNRNINLHIQMDANMIAFSSSGCETMSSFNDDDRFLIRMEDGETVQVPFEEQNGTLFVEDPDVISWLFDLFDRGHFEIAIAGTPFIGASYRCSFRVDDETAGLKQVLSHVQNNN